MTSVAVTTPVIERASSNHNANAGSATGGVLLVTTSAVYVEMPISFSRLSRYVVIESPGGFTDTVPAGSTE